MMFLRTAPMALLVAVCLFGASGAPEPWFAAYVVLLWAMGGLIYTVLRRRSPGLVEERLRPPSDRDRASRRVALPLIVGHYVLAGLDARFGWSAVPPAAQVVGLIFVAGGLGLAGWTLLSNPFASTAVRVQRERKHTVVTTGPYAFVRHPMYLGVLLFVLGSGAALGSWAAGALLLPLLAVFLRRTLFEDRMLHEELDGYAAYAAQVRARVIPGVF